MNKKYASFSQFVIRTPLLPISDVNASSLNLFKSDPLVRKAIYLASPDLYDSLNGYIKGEVKSKTKRERIVNSFLKYASRMTTRCTPFGLFAGCGVGDVSVENNIAIERGKDFSTKSRLDMDYLCELSMYLAKDQNLRKLLKFRPNSSIYEIGDEFRYVEYRYLNGKRIHYSVSVEKDEFVVQIVKLSKSGAGIQDLVTLFPEEEYEPEEIMAYIDDLIESQLLICELEPSVCGEDYLGSMIEIIGKANPNSEIYHRLKTVNKLLEEFDKDVSSDNLQVLKEIEGQLDYFPIKRKRNLLFQVDSIINSENINLSSEVGKTILDAIHVLSKFIRSSVRTYQGEFKRNFYKRFEERTIPLGKVFDSEAGISYVPGENGVPCPLIDDIFFPKGSKQRGVTEWRPIDSFLLKKLSDFSVEKDSEIVLTDEDLEQLPDHEYNLGNTFYAIAQLAKNKQSGEEIINLSTVGGSSAANLLGRFCTSNPLVESLVKKISEKEIELENGKILAEISHLPESRTGNVLLRPHLYKYEISYLSNTSHPNSIKIDNLEVSVPSGGRIALRDCSTKKEVLPKLTTAHNYSHNSLPIYHFLCDLQYQNKLSGLGFSWGSLEKEYTYLPGVRYKNVILSLARWRISKSDIKDLYEYIEEEDKFTDCLIDFRKKNNLKKEVELVEGDNTLFIDLTNIDLAKMLLQAVKNKPTFILQEFFFSDHDSIVKKDQQTFTNQLIVPFYKNN